MRIVLVFPPSLCLPNPIYHSLPVLGGALKRAGHQVRLVDLNVLAMDKLLTREWAERVLAYAARHRRKQSSVGPPLPESGESLFGGFEEKIFRAPSCKAVLRDPIRNFNPEAFRNAFSTVIDALNFYYHRDPIISPHRDTFGADVMAHEKEDPWTPLRDLYEEVLIDEVLRSDPDVVGISVAFPEQAAESIRTASKIRKKRSQIHLCAGGPLISLFPEKWLRDGWLLHFFDSVVIGDGETAIVELAAALEGHGKLDKIRNLVYLDKRGSLRKNGEELFFETLDQGPIPDFEGADMGLYLTPRPFYTAMVSRGCYWGKCTFCSLGWYKKFRMASKEKIRQDLAAICRRSGARYLYVSDSSAPPKGALNMARIIKEEKFPLFWVGAMKFEKAFLDQKYCQELAEGGCRSLLLGFETANQRLLDLMGKGFQLKDVPAMLKNLREAGISSELLWFIGFPSETRSDVLRTARFLMENRPLFGLAAFVGDYQLLPDTPIYEQPQDFGITVTGRNNAYCTYESESGITEEEKSVLKRLLAPTENRNLACNGAHLPHLAERGIDLSGIEKPMEITPELVAYCMQPPE